MKRFLILITLGALGFSTYAQNPQYQFDAHGNRVLRGLHLKKDPNSGKMAHHILARAGLKQDMRVLNYPVFGQNRP